MIVLKNFAMISKDCDDIALDWIYSNKAVIISGFMGSLISDTSEFC